MTNNFNFLAENNNKGDIMKKKNKKVNLSELIDVWDPKKQDPLGSYTGEPKDGGKPVQDADDL